LRSGPSQAISAGERGKVPSARWVMSRS
jgi:hypothetical protein